MKTGSCSDSTFDTIIVGSGLAGLTSAALLSKAGKKVALFERHSRFGGCAQSFTREGVEFDSCIHVVGACRNFDEKARGVIPRILDLFNVDSSKMFTELDPVLAVHFPDFSISLPSGLDRLADKLSEFSPQDTSGIKNLFQLAVDCKKSMLAFPLYPNFIDLLKVPFMHPLLAKYKNATVKEIIEKYIKKSELRSIIYSTTMFLGTPPSKMSFLSWVLLFISYFDDRTYYCNGTYQRLADVFVKIITDANGAVFRNSEVKSIKVNNGCVEAVELSDGNVVKAQTVVSNANPLTTFNKLLDNEINKKYIKKINSMKPSHAAFSVYLKSLSDKTPDAILANQSFYFSKWDVDACYEDIEKGVISSFYLMIPPKSESDKSSQKGTLITLTPFRTKEYWKENKTQFAENLFNIAESSIADFNAFKIVSSASPQTFKRYTDCIDGAMTGWSVTPENSKLPGPKTPVKGLYLTGQWARPGGGVNSVCVSGCYTAQTILGYKNIKEMFGDLKEAN